MMNRSSLRIKDQYMGGKRDVKSGEYLVLLIYKVNEQQREMKLARRH